VSQAHDDQPSPIERAYLLVMMIPFCVDDAGDVWLERGWHRDFVRHLTYIRRLTLVAPAYRLSEAKGQDLVRVDVPPSVTLRFVSLPKQESMLSALAALPRTASVLWDAVKSAEIVHSGIVGWPYPVGWIANAAALLQRRSLMIVVESAPWRLSDDPADHGWRDRMRASVMEVAARWFVNRATISFFTQPSYQTSLLTRTSRPGFVVPASWIDEGDVLSSASAAEAWRTKRERGEDARFLFAGRLMREKGLEVLLDAVERLRQKRIPLDLDIIGEGPLRARCTESATAGGSVRVRVLDPVPYGPAFFELVRRYHAVVVPSLSDEQPRIVFDAFSQAVPVISSDTDGLRPHVLAERTGWVVSRGDVSLLADALAAGASSPDRLERLGLEALEYARGSTHAKMHSDRRRLLSENLGL
jgi:glycosyltransferase involved in cell wall biosynthesis